MSKRIWYYNSPSPSPNDNTNSNSNTASDANGATNLNELKQESNNNVQTELVGEQGPISANGNNANSNVSNPNVPNNNVNKTRETVQKVYRLIERSRTTSTSSSIGDESSTSTSNTISPICNEDESVAASVRGRGAIASGGTSSSKNSQSNNNNNRRSSNSNRKPSPAEDKTNNNNSPASTTAATAEDSTEESELAKLRCPSLSSEIICEREQRRKKRICSDYPGLAFGLGGGSIFGSDTMMRLNLIKNELHNVINGQLKRTENEIITFNKKIQLIETDLETSKESLSSVTNELIETLQIIKKEEENERLNANDDDDNGQESSSSSLIPSNTASSSAVSSNKDDIDILIMEIDESDDAGIKEVKTQIKLIAEESDKIYNEVVKKLIVMEKELENLEETARENEIKIWQELRLRRIPSMSYRKEEIQEKEGASNSEISSNQQQNLVESQLKPANLLNFVESTEATTTSSQNLSSLSSPSGNESQNSIITMESQEESESNSDGRTKATTEP